MSLITFDIFRTPSIPLIKIKLQSLWCKFPCNEAFFCSNVEREEKRKFFKLPHHQLSFITTYTNTLWSNVFFFANFHEPAHMYTMNEEVKNFKTQSRVRKFSHTLHNFLHILRMPIVSSCLWWSCAWTWSWINLSAFLHATGVCVGSIGLIGRWNPGNLQAIKLRHIKSHEPTFSHLERLSNA